MLVCVLDEAYQDWQTRLEALLTRHDADYSRRCPLCRDGAYAHKCGLRGVLLQTLALARRAQAGESLDAEVLGRLRHACAAASDDAQDALMDLSPEAELLFSDQLDGLYWTVSDLINDLEAA